MPLSVIHGLEELGIQGRPMKPEVPDVGMGREVASVRTDPVIGASEQRAVKRGATGIIGRHQEAVQRLGGHRHVNSVSPLQWAMAFHGEG